MLLSFVYFECNVRYKTRTCIFRPSVQTDLERLVSAFYIFSFLLPNCTTVFCSFSHLVSQKSFYIILNYMNIYLIQFLVQQLIFIPFNVFQIARDFKYRYKGTRYFCASSNHIFYFENRQIFLVKNEFFVGKLEHDRQSPT